MPLVVGFVVLNVVAEIIDSRIGCCHPGEKHSVGSHISESETTFRHLKKCREDQHLDGAAAIADSDGARMRALWCSSRVTGTWAARNRARDCGRR